MGFFDAHCHTPELSYCCSPKVKLEHYAKAVRENSWLDGVVISNHGFSSYFPPEIAKTCRFLREPELFEEYEDYGNERIMEFVGLLAPFYSENLVMGMEVELLSNGQLTISDDIRDFVEVLVGSLHWGPTDGSGRSEDTWDFVFSYYEAMMKRGVDIIAHPFRWPHKNIGVIPSESIINDFVALLKKYNVAGEINGQVRPDYDPYFLTKMLEEGVKVAFSSDCHSVKNVGDFSYHKSVIKKAGLTIADIDFWRPKQFTGLSESERHKFYDEHGEFF